MGAIKPRVVGRFFSSDLFVFINIELLIQISECQHIDLFV